MLSKERIKYEEHFIPYTLMEKVIKETDIQRNIFEEEYSEFVVETLNGQGKIIKRYVGEPNFPELRRILAKELG